MSLPAGDSTRSNRHSFERWRHSLSRRRFRIWECGLRISNLGTGITTRNRNPHSQIRNLRGIALMKSTKGLREVISRRFHALAFGLVSGLLGLSSVYALPHVAQSPRDTADRLSRIDTNRAADMQVIKGTQNKAVREAIQKQIAEDFRSLQSL